MKNYPDIDAYIAEQEKKVQPILEALRKLVREIVPEAKEKISYGMPAFEYFGVLLYFAAWKNHIGIYALPETNIALKKELEPYRTSKGSIQFPLSAPIPYKLVKKIVQLRVKENLAKKALKKVGKK